MPLKRTRWFRRGRAPMLRLLSAGGCELVTSSVRNSSPFSPSRDSCPCVIDKRVITPRPRQCSVCWTITSALPQMKTEMGSPGKSIYPQHLILLILNNLFMKERTVWRCAFSDLNPQFRMFVLYCSFSTASLYIYAF